MSKVSKLTIATNIVENNPDKDQAIKTIMDVLEVTKSNAYVYWSKITKGNTNKDIVVKVERKINPITETTPRQQEIKIAEIDKVIAGLKAKGVTASPFPMI